jgi:hypothetical protein
VQSCSSLSPFFHQVEEIEFKVHNHFLTRESERFRSMVAQAPPNGRVHVPGVTAKEFENLLDFFYEGYVHLSRIMRIEARTEK